MMHTVGCFNKGAGQRYSGAKLLHCDSLYTELDDLLAAPTIFNIHNVVIQGFDPGGEMFDNREEGIGDRALRTGAPDKNSARR